MIRNHPIYAGFTILEVPKVFMYSFYYNHMKENVSDKAELILLKQIHFVMLLRSMTGIMRC